jgi:hypothetical protein
MKKKKEGRHFKNASSFLEERLCLDKSISTGAQYVTLDNKIKCLSIAVLFLAIPPIKL